MQACEVCGWDTRSGARVCSACRLERGDAQTEPTTASADPTGSSLLHDLLTVSQERAGGGTTTAVRQLHAAEGDAGAGTTTDEPLVNGTATGVTTAQGPHGAGRHDNAVSGTTPGTADAGTDVASRPDVDVAPELEEDEASGPEEAVAPQLGAVAARDETVERGAVTDQGSAAPDEVVGPGLDPVVTTTSDAGPPRLLDADAPSTSSAPAGTTSTGSAPSGSASERPADETPQSRRERWRAAFERAGAWTAVAQMALLMLGMLCVFQIVVLVVVNRFLSQAAAGGASGTDALAAHGKVTGVMFPALAVTAIAVAVFAGARSEDDSGRGGVHRRVAGLPPTLWIMIAAATAVLTMGVLDAAATAAQAQEVTLRAIIVCSVLGLTAFAAPRGFAVPEPPDDDGRRPAPAGEDRASSDESRRVLARARTDADPAGSAAADDGP